MNSIERMTKRTLDRQDRQLREVILGRIAANKRMTRAMMAHKLGMSESTLNRRLAQPRDFTLAELGKLFAELEWGKDDISRTLFPGWGE